MIFYYIECIFEIFCHIVYAFWEKNNVRSCLHISYQKRVGGFHCVWFCTLFFPLAITVFLFCGKSCYWGRKKNPTNIHKTNEYPLPAFQNSFMFCGGKKPGRVPWPELGPGFHSRSPVLNGWCLVPLEDVLLLSRLQYIKLTNRKCTGLVVIFCKAHEKRILSYLDVSQIQSELSKD